MDSQHLKQFRILQSLGPKDLGLVLDVLQEIEVLPGTVLMHENEHGDSLYLILSGEVEIVKSIGDENERVIAVLGPNHIIGEIGLIIPDGLRIASVRTRTAAKLAKLSYANFSKILERRPPVAMEIMRQLSIHLREAELDTIREMERAHQQLTTAYEKTLEGWAKAVELRDSETEAHNRRVSSLAVNLACKLGLKGDVLITIRRGALLHDIGKIGVPDHILLKPGPLNAAEREIMDKHPEYSREILSQIDFLSPVIDIPYCHHEKWDGSGYPNHLKGEEIPLNARIFSIVDVWDALTSDRPYRRAMDKSEALKIIQQGADTLFDPEITCRFIEMIGSSQ
jgi:putative nucleotidyltransferase with HDIG domain